MKKFKELETLVLGSKEDAEKFYGGNNTAGTRLRKAMLSIKTLTGEIRKEVSSIKNKKA